MQAYLGQATVGNGKGDKRKRGQIYLLASPINKNKSVPFS
jgi:hypothetical protein